MSIHLRLTVRDRRKILPCPFCGSRDLELENTHTPCYWVGCQSCEAEVTGRVWRLSDGADRGALRRAHADAKQDAIRAWCRREGQVPDPVSLECAEAALRSAVAMIVRCRLRTERPDLLAAVSVALGELRGAYEGPVGARRLRSLSES